MADGGIVEIMHELKFSVAQDASVQNFRKEIVALKNEIQSVSTLLKDKGIDNSFNGETEAVKKLQVQLKKAQKTIEEYKVALGKQTQAAMDGQKQQNGLIQEQILLLKKAKIAAEEETDAGKLGGKNDAARMAKYKLDILNSLTARKKGNIELLEQENKRLALKQKQLVNDQKGSEEISKQIALNKDKINILKQGDAAKAKINERDRVQSGVLEGLIAKRKELLTLQEREKDVNKAKAYNPQIAAVDKEILELKGKDAQIRKINEANRERTGIIEKLNAEIAQLNTHRNRATTTEGINSIDKVIAAKKAELAAINNPVVKETPLPKGDLESLELRGKRLATIQRELIGHKELQENIRREIALNKEKIAVLKGGAPAEQKILEQKRQELGIIEKLQVEQRELNQLRLRATSEGEIAMYDKRLKRMNKQLNYYGEATSGGRRNRYSILNSIKRGFGIGAGVLAFGAAFRVYEGMKDFVINSAKAAENLESVRVSFKTMIGSAEGANDTISMLQELTKHTTFGFNDAVDYSKRLLAYGVSAKDLEKDLTSLGNIAAGVGEEKMPNLILAFGQIRSKGRLMGQELRQLTEAGFNPLEEISKRTGESMTNLYKDMSAGKVSFDMVQQAMVDATTAGGRFDNLMNKQIQESLKGQIQQKNAYMQLIEQNVGNGLMPFMKMFNEGLNNAAKATNSLFNDDSLEAIKRQEIQYETMMQSLMDVNDALDKVNLKTDKHGNFVGDDNVKVAEANDLSNRRKTLIGQITSAFPDYIKQIDLAKSSNDGLNTALRVGKGLLADNMKLMGAQMSLQSYTQYAQDNSNDIIKAEERIRNDANSKGIDIGNLNNITGQDALKLYNKLTGNNLQASSDKKALDMLHEAQAHKLYGYAYDIIPAYKELRDKYNQYSDSDELTDPNVAKYLEDIVRKQKKRSGIINQMIDAQKTVSDVQNRMQDIPTLNKEISDQNSIISIELEELKKLAPGAYGSPASGSFSGMNSILNGSETNVEKYNKLMKSYTTDTDKLLKLKAQLKIAKAAHPKVIPPPTTTTNKNPPQKESKIDPYLAIDEEMKYQLNTDPHYSSVLDMLHSLYSFRTNLMDSGADKDSDQIRTLNVLINMQIREIDILKKTYDLKADLLKQDKAVELGDKMKAADFKIKASNDKNELANMPLNLLPVEKPKLDVSPVKIGNDILTNGGHLTLGGRLFGPEASVKERYDMAIGYLLDFGNEAKDIYTQIADRHIQELDREISYQEFAVQEATVLANRGNVDALRLENKRLVEAEKQREQSARKEQVINAALTESYALAAVAKAFLTSGPLAPVLIPAIIAALGASFGLVSVLVNNKTASIPTFYKGGYTGDTNTHSLAGMTHGQEFVVNAANTKKFRWLLEPLNKGKLMIPNLDKGSLSLSGSVTNDKHLIMLGDKLDLLTKAVYATEISAENRMDGNGVAQIVKKFISLDAKRFRA